MRRISTLAPVHEAVRSLAAARRCARARGSACGCGPRNPGCYLWRMNDIASLSDADLLAATRQLALRSCAVEADLLVHLGEIDERKLYLVRAHPSMFAFCTRELGFSEGAAYNPIFVSRHGRKWPA